MRATEIEAHYIRPEYCAWILYQLNHYYGPVYRPVYVVHTVETRS